jgi:predicted phosphodiesterase
MKFAIIADIHANLDAFQVVLEDCKKQQVTHYACLGDVVGYGDVNQLGSIRVESGDLVSHKINVGLC